MQVDELSRWIRKLYADNEIYKFYKCKEWIRLRDEVLSESHYECQHCLRDGIYKPAEMVHHLNEVRKRPDLALSKEYVDNKTNERRANLIALCNACHEKEHDRFASCKPKSERFTNAERW